MEARGNLFWCVMWWWFRWGWGYTVISQVGDEGDGGVDWGFDPGVDFLTGVIY